ncbi:MAG TPA: prephenate dehydratase [Polyangiaceae bacterium]|nr:prephenate dehydratase [Polyangiaceae bacterium]
MSERATGAVAFMGPLGTFSDIAVRAVFPRQPTVETSTIPAVIDCVERGAAEFGVVPIENSTEGGVSATLASLLESTLLIRGELVILVSLCLAARHFELGRIKRVVSHPQPLGQSRRWLARELPNAELVSMSSTTAAAREAARDDETAAVTSRLGAELSSLAIVAEDIQDHAENATRFVIVGREDAARTGQDKTSLVFSTAHERGALRRALAAFDDEGINLTRIESRPAPSRRWEYVFFTDIEGHRTDPHVVRALERLTHEGGTVRIFGSYPRATEPLK